MPLHLGINSGHVTPRPFVGVGGEHKVVSNGFVGVDGVWKRVYSGFSATLPAEVTGARSGAGVAQTAPSPWSVEGEGPFTYTATRTSGSSAITVQQVESDQPIYSALLASGESLQALFLRTITDTPSGVTIEATQTVTLTSVVV